MKKKALPFLLAGAALLAMTACSNGSATNQSETPTSSSSTGSVTSSVEQASSQSTAAASSAASNTSSESASTEKNKEKKEAMDISALANGYYASVKGTWQDASGNQLVFDDKGLVSSVYELYGASLTDYGTAAGGVYGGESGGFLIEFLPKGVKVADKENFTDNSDVGQDRIRTGVGLNSFNEQGSFYYRVD